MCLSWRAGGTAGGNGGFVNEEGVHITDQGKDPLPVVPCAPAALPCPHACPPRGDTAERRGLRGELRRSQPRCALPAARLLPPTPLCPRSAQPRRPTAARHPLPGRELFCLLSRWLITIVSALVFFNSPQERCEYDCHYSFLVTACVKLFCFVLSGRIVILPAEV